MWYSDRLCKLDGLRFTLNSSSKTLRGVRELCTTMSTVHFLILQAFTRGQISVLRRTIYVYRRGPEQQRLYSIMSEILHFTFWYSRKVFRWKQVTLVSLILVESARPSKPSRRRETNVRLGYVISSGSTCTDAFGRVFVILYGFRRPASNDNRLLKG